MLIVLVQVSCMGSVVFCRWGRQRCMGTVRRIPQELAKIRFENARSRDQGADTATCAFSNSVSWTTVFADPFSEHS
jgi:hypothetical protein